jgi:hypothetical protein
MRRVLRKKLSSSEMTIKLNVQRLNLDRTQRKLADRMEESRKEAKDNLARGNEAAFRTASRKYVLSKNNASAIGDLKEMAMEMIDLVDMGEVLHNVVAAGQDLVKMQGSLGLDASKLESSLAKIRDSMTHMEDIADVLSVSIESSIANPEVSADQEILRKELLTEIGLERVEAAREKEKVEKELERA